MIIDSFLFFQELDLLEIRLEYLYPFIDKFIIVEARQSFKGNVKDFIFEKNIKRFSKYINKIYYFKIENTYNNYQELKALFENSNSKILKKIGRFINEHSYYDKENLSHLLDTFHRECIHIPLKENCKDEDIILLSDLDEIPDYKIIKKLIMKQKKELISVFVQHEFQYFLNNYANSNWFGTIVGPYKLIKNHSLNLLRKDSKKFPIISNSGYHFTSIGDKKTIINKIENWGHQEYNHRIVKENIEKNLRNGKDIFYRFKIKNNKILNIEENKLLDKRISKILFKFQKLIFKVKKRDLFFNIEYLYNQILFILIRIINNPKKFLKKIFFF